MTTRDESTEAEERVAAFVAQAVGARARRVDVRGAGNSLRDFDLVFPDGSVEPLEITEHAHRATRNTFARTIAHAQAPEARALIRAWALVVNAGGEDEAFDVRRCMREVVPHLQAVEDAGIDSFSHPLMLLTQIPRGLM